MKVLIDTNVFLDVFLKREPHYELSAELLGKCGAKVVGCISASQTTDIFYLLRRAGHDANAARSIIRKITENVKTVDVTAADVNNALASEMPDYEDALLDCQAKRHRIEYIITRNEKDFKGSQVPAISPQMFLEKLYSV